MNLATGMNIFKTNAQMVPDGQIPGPFSSHEDKNKMSNNYGSLFLPMNSK